MNPFTIIKIVAVILAIAVIIYFFINQHAEELSFKDKVKISFIGFISNFFEILN